MCKEKGEAWRSTTKVRMAKKKEVGFNLLPSNVGPIRSVYIGIAAAMSLPHLCLVANRPTPLGD